VITHPFSTYFSSYIVDDLPVTKSLHDGYIYDFCVMVGNNGTLSSHFGGMEGKKRCDVPILRASWWVKSHTHALFSILSLRLHVIVDLIEIRCKLDGNDAPQYVRAASLLCCL
jgi:hypothetical protein